MSVVAMATALLLITIILVYNNMNVHCCVYMIQCAYKCIKVNLYIVAVKGVECNASH